jgi:glycosyltransferase involved in cell wall biosynthesis
MGLFGFIKRLIVSAPPPAKFLTPDSAPKAEVKAEPKPESLAPALPKRSGKPVILYLVTKSNFGGAQRYVYDLAANAPPEYEAVVMCGDANLSNENSLLVNKLTEMNIRTIVIKELRRDLGLADFSAMLRLYKVIKEESPHILHLNSSKAGGLGALAGRLAGIPNIIFTAHGWAFHENRGIFPKIFIWLASVATIMLSHKVICVSAYDRNAFRGWFFGDKLVAIHNALPPMDYYERADARRDLVPHHELYSNDLWIGTVAELTKNKNISLALKAVKKTLDAGCNVFYAIVGDGEDRLLLEDEVQALKIQDNVRFLGFVSNAGLYIQAFDIGLLPSSKEGLPYFVLECLHSGIPVVASSVGGIPEIIRDGEDGLLAPPNDVDAFASALIKLCKDEELRVNMSKHPAPDRFETMLRETFALYR